MELLKSLWEKSRREAHEAVLSYLKGHHDIKPVFRQFYIFASHQRRQPRLSSGPTPYGVILADAVRQLSQLYPLKEMGGLLIKAVDYYLTMELEPVDPTILECREAEFVGDFEGEFARFTVTMERGDVERALSAAATIQPSLRGIGRLLSRLTGVVADNPGEHGYNLTLSNACYSAICYLGEKDYRYPMIHLIRNLSRQLGKPNLREWEGGISAQGFDDFYLRASSSPGAYGHNLVFINSARQSWDKVKEWDVRQKIWKCLVGRFRDYEVGRTSLNDAGGQRRTASPKELEEAVLKRDKEEALAVAGRLLKRKGGVDSIMRAILNALCHRAKAQDPTPFIFTNSAWCAARYLGRSQASLPIAAALNYACSAR